MLAKTWTLLKQTGTEWTSDNAPRLGAALAFYSVLSIAPLTVIALAIGGAVFGADAARGELVGQVEGMVGRQGAAAIQEMIAHAEKPATGTLAAIAGIVTLLVGAGGVFGQLQDTLNVIWKVRPKPGRGLWRMIRDRFFSFTLVLGTGFLLLASLVVTAAMHALGEYLLGLMPGAQILGHMLNFVLSFAATALLFALIFRFIPDARVAWSDVWIGALLTAALFTLGKFLLGLYLGRGAVSSAYGAAGSLVVLLVWIYYSAQILFFGAEFTQVYAKRYGSGVKPAQDAVLTNGDHTASSTEPALRR
jgi:membrane protein